MPKVSDAHMAARREQILQAAMTCFAERGFQATSIADIIEASELSAGSVYRYYASKDDLIEAIVLRVLGQTAARFDELLERSPATDLAEAVQLALETINDLAPQAPTDLTRVAVQAWAEALRNDRVRDVVADAYSTIRTYFEEVAHRARSAGVLPAEAKPEQIAAALLSLVVGYLLQHATLGNVDVVDYSQAVHALVRGEAGR